MPLSPGDKLGQFDVLSLLGKGGMGEVYRARDMQLKREVALKVLPAVFSSDPDRLARFQREAELLASLDHPNIGHIYGMVQSERNWALVLALIEGPTLDDRIKQGPLPADEAIAISRQIIDALEYAHEHGVIHRDLKPANIKVTPDGVVKVLDFGLAKALDQRAATSLDPENSPTLTMGATQAGVIMGTAAYMSPEQAVGKAADRRSDIFSFGVVLYEMLTGSRPFRGESMGDTLAAVVKDAPDWSVLPEGTPSYLRKLLERMLVKDRRERLQAIGEARIALGSGGTESPAQAASLPHKAPKAPWVLGAVMAAVAAVALWGPWRTTLPVDRPLTRLSVDLGPDAIKGPRITAVLSPDGQRIVFTGRSPDGGRQLFTCRLDQTEATPLAGTSSTSSATQFSPFFSPDGQWIGFLVDGKLKKVAVEGGSAITLGDVPTVYGGSWSEDGNIILGTATGLLRMPATGGVAQPVKGSEETQAFPQVLPGAQAVLFNGRLQGGDFEASDIGVLEFATGQRKALLHGGYWPRYLATSGGTGHLLYMHEGTLFGVGFDPQRLEIRGTPTPLLQDIAASADATSGGGQFAYSETGTLVYLSGRAQNNVFPIQWLDGAGKITALLAQPGAYNTPRLSPDGKRLAYTVKGGKGGDVWVYDLERETPTQLTFTAPGIIEVAWAADSQHVVFGDGAALWWIRADGAGQPQRLLEKMDNPRPASFSPAMGKEGRLVFSPLGSSLPDLWTMPVDLSDPEHPKPGKAEPFLVDPKVVEVDPAFSPDGKFLAYASNESGPNEVFVRPFPGPGGKWKVSTAGGKFPAWSRATHEILFLGGDDHIMAASYTLSGDTFSAGKPRVWSPTPVRRMGVQQNFDVSPDGKRVVMFPQPAVAESQGNLHATFLLNFFDEVRRRVPVGK